MSRFLPDGFEPPRSFATDAFVLEPLGPEHNEGDYDAWTSSLEHIRSSPGWEKSSWPREMSLDDNRGDLQRHADDFEARKGFTYTVLDPQSREIIGCVYIYPSGVRSWVRASRAELDRPLRDAVAQWIESSWQFA